MKRKLLIIAICLFVYNAKSQNITASEFPMVGDTIKCWPSNDTNSIIMPTQGSSVTWDYSGLKIDKSKNSLYRYIQPSSGQNGSKFTQANIAGVEPGTGSGQTWFYNRTSNQVEIIGTNTLTGSAMVYSDKELWLKYPMAPGNSNTDTYQGSTAVSFGVSTERIGTVTSSYYGSGKLVLPGKTYPNAICIFIESNQIDSIKTPFGNTGAPFTEKRYMWFVSGVRGLVFDIKITTSSSGFGGGTSLKTAYMKQATDTVSNGFSDIPTQISLPCYPNPANDLLYIQTDTHTPNIKLFNLTGQQFILPVEKIGDNIYTLQINSLNSGIYYFSLNNTVYRFIKI